MKFIGIIAAKSQSLRFPGKNRYYYKGTPLFWHSVEPLLTSTRVNDVIVTTDCMEIANFCSEKEVKVYSRHLNAVENEAPLIEVLKHVCLNYPANFDYVITIMANCPGHTCTDVDKAIEMIENNPDLNEIRSFDYEGNETGLMVFNKKTIMRACAISSHIGAITTNGFEVHYKTDLDGR